MRVKGYFFVFHEYISSVIYASINSEFFVQRSSHDSSSSALVKFMLRQIDSKYGVTEVLFKIEGISFT